MVANPDNLVTYKLKPSNEEAAVSALLECLGQVPAHVLADNWIEPTGKPTMTEIKRRLTKGVFSFRHLPPTARW
jgi:hypothetical protein